MGLIFYVVFTSPSDISQLFFKQGLRVEGSFHVKWLLQHMIFTVFSESEENDRSHTRFFTLRSNIHCRYGNPVCQIYLHSYPKHKKLQNVKDHMDIGSMGTLPSHILLLNFFPNPLDYHLHMARIFVYSLLLCISWFIGNCLAISVSVTFI